MTKLASRSLALVSLSLAALAMPQFSRAAKALQTAKMAPAVVSTSATFEPLNRWAAAVRAGDEAGLKSLYSASPAAESKTPEGDSSDPTEEPTFWSGLESVRHISDFNAKILEIQRPQPGLVSLVLRVEFLLGPKEMASPFVISAAQLWVKQGDDWKIARTQRSDVTIRFAERLPEPQKPNTDLYAPPEEAPAEIKTALAAASTDHKRVILVFGGNWCYDCHVLDTAFRSPSIGPIVETNYHVVHVNIGEMDKNLDIAQKYGVPLNKGVPSLAILSSDGLLLYSQQNGEFESSLRLAPADIVAFLDKWKSPHAPTSASRP
jgi:thioredoxin 1